MPLGAQPGSAGILPAPQYGTIVEEGRQDACAPRLRSQALLRCEESDFISGGSPDSTNEDSIGAS